jgi:hypothetical protein
MKGMRDWTDRENKGREENEGEMKKNAVRNGE